MNKIYELKISENFNEFIGENVEDEAISLEDTTELLDSYVDAVDTELDFKLAASITSSGIESFVCESTPT